jgi:TfoX/Sxy family transcriptional regulator of competence genes
MSAETFTFKAKGKSYTIPAYSQIPMRALRRALDEENQVKQSFIIVEETVTDKKALDALESMTVSEFVQFVEAWAGESGATSGD